MSQLDLMHYVLHPYKWQFMRFMHFVECAENPNQFNFITKQDEVEARNAYTMLHVEAIISFLSFLEMLPIYLQHTRELNGIQRALLEYNASDSEDFYRKLPTHGVQLTYFCLGYDLCELVEGDSEALQTSAEVVHEYLLKCADFYIQMKGLLNAFKHGMRVVPGEDTPPRYSFVYFPYRTDDNKAQIVVWDADQTERIKRVFIFLIAVLMDLVDAFRQVREDAGEATGDGVVARMLHQMWDPAGPPDLLPRG